MITTPGLQRRCATMALVCVKASLDGWRPVMQEQDAISRQLQKVNRWHNECLAQLGVCPPLKDNMNMARRPIHLLAPYVSRQGMSGVELLDSLSALTWCAALMVTGVYAACMTYRKQPCWRYLDQTIWTLGERYLLPLSPGAEEKGLQIYEKVA